MTTPVSNTWKDQFINSYNQQWEDTHQLSDISISAEEHRQLLTHLGSDQWLEQVFNSTTDKELFAVLTVRSLMFDFVRSTRRIISSAHALCGSPIENAMLAALTIQADQYGMHIFYVVNGAPIPIGGYISDDLLIEPQAKIGNYRVDFLLTLKLKDFTNVPLECLPPVIAGCIWK